MLREQRVSEKKNAKLEEVQNVVCREGIDLFDSMVTKYVAALNKFLPQEYQLDMSNKIFNIEVEYDSQGEFENNGNTRCPGNQYRVTWAFKMFPVDHFDAWWINNHHVDGILRFHLEFSERISDGRSRSRYFTSYVNEIDMEGNKREPFERVFYINNNYSDAVANHNSMVQTIKALEDVIRTHKIVKKLETVDFSEFSKKSSFFSY